LIETLLCGLTGETRIEGSSFAGEIGVVSFCKGVDGGAEEDGRCEPRSKTGTALRVVTGEIRVREGDIEMDSLKDFPGEGGGSVKVVGAEEKGLSVDSGKLEILCNDFFAESGGGMKEGGGWLLLVDFFGGFKASEPTPWLLTSFSVDPPRVNFDTMLRKRPCFALPSLT